MAESNICSKAVVLKYQRREEVDIGLHANKEHQQITNVKEDEM
jgi:hypothetical protein